MRVFERFTLFVFTCFYRLFIAETEQVGATLQANIRRRDKHFICVYEAAAHVDLNSKNSPFYFPFAQCKTDPGNVLLRQAAPLIGTGN